MIDRDSESYDPDMEPEYTLRHEPSDEPTDEHPMTAGEYLFFLDQVQGWKEGSPRHDPFEDAPDPRKFGI